MKSNPTVGILKTPKEQYANFLRLACKELGWPFVEIDFFAPDWLEQIQACNDKVDLYALWPVPEFASVATMESRLGVLERITGKPICPPLRDLWFHENKERQYYWLRANGLPVLDSAVIHRYQDYIAARNLGFPIVAKTITGTRGHGVHILNNEVELESYARQAFREGIPSEPVDPPPPAWRPLYALRSLFCRALHAVEREHLYYDRQHGLAFFQKYLPRYREWRVTTIRNRAQNTLYMWGYEKIAEANNWNASGSNIGGWEDPPAIAKQLALQVQELQDFDSICVDVLECLNTGRFYIIELHICWGWLARGQLKINGTPGRWVYIGNKSQPIFEQGEWSMDAERLKCFVNSK